MEYRKLGNLFSISTIGFGCMSLKGDMKNAEQIIHRAIDLGINFFDTADLYEKGQNEEMVGKALKSKRQQIILATKVGNQWKADGSGWDWNPRKEYILRCIDESLSRLQTDYVDLYQLHGGTIDDPIEETIDAFELLKRSGKIRTYGISSIRPNVITEYVKRSSIASVMMQYSLLDRRPEEMCLELLCKNSIGVLSRGSLAQGLLINKSSKEYLDYQKDDVAAAAKAVHSFSHELRTPAQTAIKFVVQNPALTSAVVGIRTMGQLEEAVGTINSPNLTDAEMRMLRECIKPNFYQQHR